MPPGYHHVDITEVVGHGRTHFENAAARILAWDMHRGAGLSVHATSPHPHVDAVVVLSLGPLRIPCRVVYLVDEPAERGFAYGTLNGHPECGEERFTVQYDTETDEVRAHIRAFSKPGNRLVALGGPLNRLTQRVATGRYVDALR